MNPDQIVRPFAIEHAPDGPFYLHANRRFNANGKAFDSERKPEGFATEAEARAFAAEHMGATDDLIAPDPSKR